jgi:hypothetical protein
LWRTGMPCPSVRCESQTLDVLCSNRETLKPKPLSWEPRRGWFSSTCWSGWKRTMTRFS